MAYLLDANVFIAANNLHYGLDFCPAFWEWLIANNAAGKVFSIEKVGDEVQALADELSEWAAARGEGFVVPPDPAMFPSLSAVSMWANGQRYEPAAARTGALCSRSARMSRQTSERSLFECDVTCLRVGHYATLRLDPSMNHSAGARRVQREDLR